jgi:hypothetical protein
MYGVVYVNAFSILLASEGKGVLSASHCDIYQAMKTWFRSYDPLPSKSFTTQQEMWCNHAKPLYYNALKNFPINLLLSILSCIPIYEQESTYYRYYVSWQFPSPYFHPKTPSSLYFKTWRFSNWIPPLSSGRTYSGESNLRIYIPGLMYHRQRLNLIICLVPTV